MSTSPLAPDALAAIRRELVAALDSPTGQGPAELLDAIRELEQLVCTATAAQTALSAELDSAVRADHEALKIPTGQQGRGIASMVAYARRESPHRGVRHLGLAKVVTTELPHTWAAWRQGRITEWTAAVIARETACLELSDRQAVDALVAADAQALENTGIRELVGTLLGHAARLDPAAVVRRRRNAEADRHVSLRPAPDTMTWLTALLPVQDGVAVYAALTGAADTARAAGDERSRGQLMADTLVARSLATDTGQAGVTLDLVMTDSALFAGADDMALLDGGAAGAWPVPAELARELAAHTLDAAEDLWLRRLYTHPVTGELAAADSRARLFPSAMRRLIRLRDRQCRTPWCDAPVRHIDHAQAHDAGGSTDLANGQGLCTQCNHAKQAPRWRAGPTAAGVTTTLPTGHSYATRPPPWRRIDFTQAECRLHYALAT